MTHKILFISLALFGFGTLTLSATPRLNISLPSKRPIIHYSHRHIEKPSESISLEDSKGSSIGDFLVLKSTKNSELKAIIKRKIYGLRYTKTW